MASSTNSGLDHQTNADASKIKCVDERSTLAEVTVLLTSSQAQQLPTKLNHDLPTEQQ